MPPTGRSLLGGKRTVKSGEPIDIDLDDLVKKNTLNQDPNEGSTLSSKGDFSLGSYDFSINYELIKI